MDYTYSPVPPSWRFGPSCRRGRFSRLQFRRQVAPDSQAGLKSQFTRHYYENPCKFIFLCLLICWNSGSSPAWPRPCWKHHERDTTGSKEHTISEDASTIGTRVSQPPIGVALVFRPVQGISPWEANVCPTCPHRLFTGQWGWGQLCMTPRQTCTQPSGFKSNLRSKTLWFTGFCRSHQVSQFAHSSSMQESR